MCGIVGILGHHEAAPRLVEGLQRLEYRGYDSAGIATVNDGKLDRRRAMGKLVELSDLLVHNPLAGKAGIGHTRWATHGAPSIQNAHPHKSGPVAVVHNGIIENYKDLRAELSDLGYEFVTETDTETVVVLCQHYLSSDMGPRKAAKKTISRLEGAFALCFLFDGEGDLIIAARKGSPLAIGYGDGEMFVGSDALALAPMTNRLTYLEEGDYAFVTREGAEIFNEKGVLANRAIKTIELEAAAVEKGGHAHFMSKEIFEQPTVIGNAIKHYVNDDGTAINLDADVIDFTQIDRITMVACGTAFYACQVAKYWFEQLAKIPVEIDIASEFRYREPPLSKKTAALFVSQSGETADTLAALRYCKGKAGRILSVVNVASSTIARESDVALPILAGTEIGVASTKAFTCQLVALVSLAILAGRQRGELTSQAEADLVRELGTVPGLVNAALNQNKAIASVARKISSSGDVLFLGRGVMYPLAMEGALKLKEISYIHAEGYASGELKHGPIALVDKSVPIVVMAPKDLLFEKTVSNMQEVLARKGRVVLITDRDGDEIAGEDVWRSIVMPQCPSIFTPLIYAIPAQLIAYHAAVAKGTDVDQPRNLAKSVTVE
jgi:glucosamine--fructose-6-phosphate aminotransferase (isomerizing)